LIRFKKFLREKCGGDAIVNACGLCGQDIANCLTITCGNDNGEDGSGNFCDPEVDETFTILRTILKCFTYFWITKIT
jgi:hypothetical protein